MYLVYAQSVIDRAIEQVATAGEMTRRLVETKKQKNILYKQPERWIKSGAKPLADALDYEKAES